MAIISIVIIITLIITITITSLLSLSSLSSSVGFSEGIYVKHLAYLSVGNNHMKIFSMGS